MRTKAEQILADIENLKIVERNYYLNGSETSKNIWAELERYAKQLRTIMKAGDFDDLGEREIPALIDRIRSKRSDWLGLINIEKARDAAAVAANNEFTQTKYKLGAEAGRQRAHKNSGAGRELAEWLEGNKSTIESFVATTFIVILVQLSLNVFLLNQVKITTQLSIINPLEQQLQMTETKNIEMARRLASMKKEITLYRTLMKNMPFGVQKKTSKVQFDSVNSLESLGLVAPDNSDLASMSGDGAWAD